MCRTALNRDDIQTAWEAAKATDKQEAWELVGQAALSILDIPTALAAFRKAGNASMVLALDKIAHVDDRHLLAGHALSLIEQDYDAAENMFLRANDAASALTMRKHLKHWDAALKLAEAHDPDGMADIMSQHAAALEMQGNVSAALAHFQDALARNSGASEQVATRCRAGVARCLIQTGDVRGGMRTAHALGRHDVLLDCAAMLENHSTGGLQLEAAELFEAAGEAERACALYIRAKAFTRAEPLIKRVQTPALLIAVRTACCMVLSVDLM
jgi:WD repeat-containing protein 19